MEFVLAVGIRGGLGFMFGLLFGIGTLLLTLLVVPAYYTPPLWMLSLTSGAGTSVAAFLAWLKPEAPWKVVVIGLLLAVAGGLVGGWVGFWYAKVAYPDGVRNVLLVSRSVRSPAVMPFITSGAIFSTALGAIYYTVRLLRYNEV